jgi:hypothetical protein
MLFDHTIGMKALHAKHVVDSHLITHLITRLITHFDYSFKYSFDYSSDYFEGVG